jgi:hypothetical protein
MTPLPPSLIRFARCQSGTALVEFGISLPLILAVAFGTIDSMRLLWSYQAAVAGVRDATRYLARTAPDDICTTGGSLTGEEPRLLEIVATSIGGGGLYPEGVTITGVTADLDCVGGLGLRTDTVPVATVTADLSIALPFSSVFTLIGGSGWGTIETSVTETARIYGL